MRSIISRTVPKRIVKVGIFGIIGKVVPKSQCCIHSYVDLCRVDPLRRFVRRKGLPLER